MIVALNSSSVHEMSSEELMDINGGHWLVPVVIISFAIAFSAGVYSGYREAAANNK